MTPEELTKMTKAELLELAKGSRLRVTGLMTKSELIEAIEAADRKRKASLGAKPKSAAQKKDFASEDKRLEAAKKAARKFISGVQEKPRAAKKSRPGEAPARVAAKPPVEKPAPMAPARVAAKPAAAKPVPAAPVKPAPAAPARPTPAAVKPVPPTLPAPSGFPVKPAAAGPPRPAARPAPPEPPHATVKPPAKPPEAAKPAAPAPQVSPPKAARKPVRAKAEKKRAPEKPAAKPEKPAAEPEKAREEAIRQMAEEGKYYLGAEGRVMPPVEAIEIPRAYNVDRIVAMVRDPYWIFTYWEITDHKYHELERAFGDVWPSCKMILRVYDKTDAKESHFDIPVTREARTWYINVSAERRYQIAIGALSPDGRFEIAAISNIVETPSFKVSDRVDEHWMVPDDVFDKIFAASGGHDMHAASGELRKLMEKHLLEQITSGSGAVSSFGSGALYQKARGFRLWVATELILYGGTEPDARVTVQGKDVKLRPDGTFSLRFALPDGKIDLPVTAESSDGVEERTIETDVTKKSAKKAPVLK